MMETNWDTIDPNVTLSSLHAYNAYIYSVFIAEGYLLTENHINILKRKPFQHKHKAGYSNNNNNNIFLHRVIQSATLG